MSWDAGLQVRSHRRGAIPFVSLWALGWLSESAGAARAEPLCGSNPLTAKLQTTARCAMRTFRADPSSMGDMRLTRSLSPEAGAGAVKSPVDPE
jgi:hypothetical protein